MLLKLLVTLLELKNALFRDSFSIQDRIQEFGCEGRAFQRSHYVGKHLKFEMKLFKRAVVSYIIIHTVEELVFVIGLTRGTLNIISLLMCVDCVVVNEWTFSSILFRVEV